jgi:hypothetical protein
MKRRQTKRSTRRRSTYKRSRRKRSTYKTRRQHGTGLSAHLMEPVKASIKRMFPTHETTITENEDAIDISMACASDATIRASVSPDQMAIDQISICPPDLSGTQIIHGLIAVARELNLPVIRLSDKSTVYYPSSEYGNPKCSVFLHVIKILTSPTHVSWYGSMGFQSESHEEEQKANRELAESMMHERMIPAIAEKRKARAVVSEKEASRKRVLQLENNAEGIRVEKRALKQRLKEAEDKDWTSEVTEDLESVFPGVSDMSIQDAVKTMVATQRTWESCEDPRVRMFIEVCRVADSLIQYNPMLSLTLH